MVDMIIPEAPIMRLVDEAISAASMEISSKIWLIVLISFLLGWGLNAPE